MNSIWMAVSPTDKIIAGPFDTERDVKVWAMMSIDEKYRPYRPVEFVKRGWISRWSERICRGILRMG